MALRNKIGAFATLRSGYPEYVLSKEIRLHFIMTFIKFYFQDDIKYMP